MEQRTYLEALKFCVLYQAERDTDWDWFYSKFAV